MPVQRITQGGETLYRWGNSGKLYKNREDAVKQGEAAYANGYRADAKAKRDGRQVTKDLEYDMGHNPKMDAKAEAAGRKVTKDVMYDMKRKRR